MNVRNEEKRKEFDCFFLTKTLSSNVKSWNLTNIKKGKVYFIIFVA